MASQQVREQVEKIRAQLQEAAGNIPVTIHVDKKAATTWSTKFWDRFVTKRGKRELVAGIDVTIHASLFQARSEKRLERYVNHCLEAINY